MLAVVGWSNIGWPTAWSLLWIAVGGAYVWAVDRTRRAGDPGRAGHRWPPRRLTLFLCGIALVAAAPVIGSAAGSSRPFASAVIEHLVLGMAGPAFLALGAPVALALRAAGPARPTVRRVVHHPVVSVLTNPFVVWPAFSGSLLVLYLTPLLRFTESHGAAHLLVHAHMVVTGTLFFGLVLGVDGGRWTLPHAGRALLLVLSLPVHAFLGVVLMTADRPLPGALPGPDVLADQRLAASILWGGGELILLVVGGPLIAAWFRSEEQKGHREDVRRDLLGTSSEPRSMEGLSNRS